MIEVPSYQVMIFISWLKKVGAFGVLKNIDEGKLYPLAREFITTTSIMEQYKQKSPHKSFGNINYDWNKQDRASWDEHAKPLWQGSECNEEETENIHEAARRLSYSVAVAHRRLHVDADDIYNSIIAESAENLVNAYENSINNIESDMAHNIGLMIAPPSRIELLLAAKFIIWIMSKDPVDLDSICSEKEMLMKITQEFCQESQIPQANKQAKVICDWILTSGSGSALSRILNTVLGVGFPLPEKYREPREFLRHLMTKRFQGIFLFRRDAGFSNFVKRYGSELHWATGEHMDIYFNLSEVTKGHGGALLRDSFKSIGDEHMPTFVIWHDDMDQAKEISLRDLEKEQIVCVVERVVSKIKKDPSVTLDQLKAAGDAAVQELRNMNNPPRTIHANQYIETNKGVVKLGAASVVVSASGPVIVSGGIVEAAADLINNPSNSQNIKTIAEALVGQIGMSSAVSSVDRAQASVLLNELADSATDERSVEKAALKWQNWLKSIGSRANDLVSLISNVVTLSGAQGAQGLTKSILGLLGISVP